MSLTLEALSSPVISGGIALVGATALLVLYNNWQKARGAHAIPQPMRTKEDVQYVERASYHKHAELNRLAHDQLKADIKASDANHNALAREVSGLSASGRMIEARLTQMEHKIDRLLTLAQPAE